MQDTDKISQIACLHREMKEVILQTNIGETKYDRIVKYVLKYNEEELQELLDKLSFIKSSSYKELHKIYHMSGDTSLWKQYKLLGIKDLPEQILFKEAKKTFKEEFATITIPERFNKKKNNEDSTTEHDSDQKDSTKVSL